MAEPDRSLRLEVSDKYTASIAGSKWRQGERRVENLFQN
jgi:hypothetical protein